MTSRERVIRALTFDHPDRVPRQLWHLPGVAFSRAEELERFRAMFPDDIVNPGSGYGRSLLASGDQYRRGSYTDEWGCTFEVLEDGVVGEVKRPPLAEWSALAGLRPPREILSFDWSSIDRARESTDCFILGGTSVRPFERLQFLRGTERLLLDLAAGEARVHRLLAIVHGFYLEEISRWIERDVDGVSFMDDWGAQRSLLVRPALWREYFKPLYREYARLIRSKGKFVFFHSDGMIAEIIPDLLECGIHALNSQLFCMDIEELGRRYRGRLCFWGEIDRQRTLPLGSVEDVRAAVRRVRRALWSPEGGVIAQCEWGLRDPWQNVAAVFEEWNEPA